MTNEATSAMHGLIQQPVWGVEITIGTRLSMEFGDEMPREPKHGQPHGRWHLLLLNCHWRIEDSKSVLVGSDDDDLMERIPRLHFGKVSKIQLSQPTNDLEIVFDEGLRLVTFLTYSLISSESRQWYLFCPDDVVWIVEGGGSVICKNRYE
jgi:hypothetical protein